MTNTKFRKRALLSSVAMLLVALVALGSATFAWFTTNTHADADGLVIKSTAARGIVVQSESARAQNIDFASKTYLDSNAAGTATVGTAIAVGPASFDFDSEDTDDYGKFFKTTSGDPDISVTDVMAAAVTDATAARTGSFDVYAEKVYVKVLGEDGAAVNMSVSVTANTATGASEAIVNSARVLVTNSDNSVVYFYGAGSGATFTANTYLKGTAAAGSYSTVKSDATQAAVACSSKSIGTVSVSGNDYVNVYVFLDGEDEGCYTSAVNAANVLTAVNLDFDLA